jgi:choline dehydrogenase-like flavoprotein
MIRTSVTIRYGKIHDIDNLFVADGSLHVTNGAFNPVLTIMALGYLVSDHIVRNGIMATGSDKTGADAIINPYNFYNTK